MRPMELSRTVRASDGTELWLTSEDGDGPPVVLLHGLACNGSMWSEVRSRLVPARRVIVIDLRGHGRSVPVRDGFCLEQQADDVRVLLEELDLRDSVLVGHSGGGYAALAFAVQFPDVARHRVRGIVTIGTSGTLVSARERLILRFSASQAFYSLLGIPPLGRQLVRKGAFGSRPQPPLVEATRIMAVECPRATKAGWVRAISGTSQQEAIRGLTVPLVAATGSQDATVPPRRVEALARNSPRGSSEILDGCGHMAPVENPSAVTALILNVAGRAD